MKHRDIKCFSAKLYTKKIFFSFSITSYLILPLLQLVLANQDTQFLLCIYINIMSRYIVIYIYIIVKTIYNMKWREYEFTHDDGLGEPLCPWASSVSSPSFIIYRSLTRGSPPYYIYTYISHTHAIHRQIRGGDWAGCFQQLGWARLHFKINLKSQLDQKLHMHAA